MRLAALALGLCLQGLLSCAPAPPPAPPEPPAAADTPTGPRVTPQVAAALNTSLTESATRAAAFEAAVTALLAAPATATYEAAVAAWRPLAAAVESWHWAVQLPAELAPGLRPLRALQYQLAAWPLQPAFLDDFGEFQRAGLVHTPDLPITASSLQQQHGFTYAGEVVLGVYGGHFILTGNVAPEAAHLQAVAQLTPRLREQGYKQLGEVPANRRRELLRLQAAALARDAERAATMAVDWRAALDLVSANDFSRALAEAGARMAAAWLEEWRAAENLPEADAERELLLRQGPARAARQLRGYLAVYSLMATPAPAADAALVALTSGDLDTAQTALAQWLVSLGGR